MSRMNPPTNIQMASWSTADVPTQSSSSANWATGGLTIPQAPTQYASIYASVSPNSPLQSPFNTRGTHGARPGDASSSGNEFLRSSFPLSSLLRNSYAAQALTTARPPPTQPTRGDRTTATVRENVHDNSTQRPPRRPKTRAPSAAQWQQNKARIEKLYMNQKLPLSEVMQMMERDHKFSATERMYKNKFTAWKWSKNLTQEKASWMAAKIEARQPKETVFSHRHQTWTKESLERKFGQDLQRRPVDYDPGPTPNGITYQTPLSPNESLQMSYSTASRSPAPGIEEVVQPIFYLDKKPLRFHLVRPTVPDLRNLLDDASRAASAKNYVKADADFREAVSGFRFLLSPTHEETLRAGYEYASFYAKSGNMDKADEVLDWMSENHVSKWHHGHENTCLHYSRMAKLFLDWGRQEDAETLVYKILDGTGDYITGVLRSGSQHRHSVADIDLEQSFLETDDSESMRRQLEKLDLAITTGITGLDNILEVILKQCENHPDDMRMALNACRAKCALAKLYSAAGKAEQEQQALKNAYRSLEPLLRVSEEPISRDTIAIARRLSFLLFKAKNELWCNAVLEKVISSLTAQRSIPTYRSPTIDTFIFNFILKIAFQFHEADSWDKCRYWLERGYGLAIRLLGQRSPEAHKFDKILRKKDFDMRASTSIHELMDFSGGLFFVNTVSTLSSW